MPCTVDCLSQYGCLPYFQSKEEAIYAPFVELKIGNFGIITVGNESSPNFQNQACITSFQCGFEYNNKSFGAEFEVTDIGGVCYRRVIQAMTKTHAESDKDAEQITFDFGWILKNCDGSLRKESVDTLYAKRLTGAITFLETSMDKGCIKMSFKVEGQTALEIQQKHEHFVGSEDQKISLKQAITRLCTESDPKYSRVKFFNKDGKTLEFDTGGKEGPRGVWPCNQKDKLSSIRTWLSAVKTKDGRGIFLIYDPTDRSLILQEDRIDRKNPDCNCRNTLGTFLVNGGDCGNVIEFNPKITFIASNVTAGGVANGSTSGKSDKKAKPSNKVQQDVGPQTSATVQQHDLNHASPDEIGNKTMDALTAHLESNTPYETATPIEAEMKIIGEPELGLTYPGGEKDQTFASVIFINPFHLSTTCTWITYSNCNSILSNKKWLLKGVNHQIQSGSYVTTLKLSLDTPNQGVDADKALGGCGTEFFNGPIGKSIATEKQGPK
jgi:hypothetical protein